MTTKDLYTTLPQQINNQISRANQNLNVNLGGVREVFQEGVQPIGLSELGNSLDTQIKPASGSIIWRKQSVEGKTIVILAIEHSGQDEQGHQTNHKLTADFYRDKDNNGTFEENEFIGSIDLTSGALFTDKDTPKEKTVRYKALIRDSVNGLSNWSASVTIDTTDNVTPYATDLPTIITDGVLTDSHGEVCNAILKVEKHYDDDFLKIEIQYRTHGAIEWIKQADITNFAETVPPSTDPVGPYYYYQYLKNLVKGAMYEIQTRCVRKSGNPSEWSSIKTFQAGDFIVPGPVVNATALNMSGTSPALEIDIHFGKPIDNNGNIDHYKIFRWRYYSTTGIFEDTPTAMTPNIPSTSANIYTMKDTTVVLDRYYAYQIISVDTSGNESTAVWTNISQCVEQLDSTSLDTTWGAETNNFPVNFAWPLITTTKPYFYLVFREHNTTQNKVLFTMLIDKSLHNASIPLNLFSEVYASEFLDILPWQTDHNYRVELWDATTAGGQIQPGTLFGTDSFLINPKPANVQGSNTTPSGSPSLWFVSSYDSVGHSIVASWQTVLGDPTNLPFSSLTGYEMRETDIIGKAVIEAHPTQSQADLTAKDAVWSAALPIVTTPALTKDSKSMRIPLPATASPSTSAIIKYYLIKAVGNFFATYSRSSVLSKVVYSADAAISECSTQEKLPAPIVDDISSAILDAKSLRVSWIFNSARAAKEFILYGSLIEANLTDNIPDEDFIIYRGPSTSCVIDKLGLGDVYAPIAKGTQYYFKVIPVDNTGLYGLGSLVFKNISPDAHLTTLPEPLITGNGFVRAVPFPTSAQTPAPLKQGTEVRVFKERTVRFETGPTLFYKNIYVDRIKWYISINDAPYTLAKTTMLDPSIQNVPAWLTNITDTYTSPVDLVFFKIIAVLGIGDDIEGSRAQAQPSKYSKIDTEKPVIEFTKILYSDGTNAINKNGYINTKTLVSGLYVSFLASEKNPNSGIQKVEYSLGGSSWTLITTPVLNIPAASLGADTEIDGKYRDISLQLRAYDNADNTETTTKVFRKDTVGPDANPAHGQIPTGISYSVGKTVKFKWTNPTLVTRNIFDGVRFKILGIASETSSETFEYKPVAAPSSLVVNMYAFDIADNEVLIGASPYTITNAAPIAPVNVLAEGSVGGARIKWDAVLLDINGGEEDVVRYDIQYQIGHSDAGTWKPATPLSSFATNTEITLDSTDAALCAADSLNYIWVRVRAVDNWGLAGAYSSSGSARPKTITSVDMTGNIFKFQVAFGGGLTKTSGTSDDIIDADYSTTKTIVCSNTSAGNGYIEIDMIKSEWIPEIKLRFKNNVTYDFVISYLEDGANTWKFLLPQSGTGFSTLASIKMNQSALDGTYFEYNQPNASGNESKAWFRNVNFVSDTRALYLSKVRVHFYTTGTLEISEIQPIVMSLANIFYGNTLALDDMISIKSKNDDLNYVYLDKTVFKIFGSDGGSPTPAAVEKVVLGKQAGTSIYGCWLKDGISIGGSTYADGVIKADSTGKVTINSVANSTKGTMSVTQTATVSENSILPCFVANANNIATAGYKTTSTMIDNTATGSYTALLSDITPPIGMSPGPNYHIAKFNYIARAGVYGLPNDSALYGLQSDIRTIYGDLSIGFANYYKTYLLNHTNAVYSAAGVFLWNNSFAITSSYETGDPSVGYGCQWDIVAGGTNSGGAARQTTLNIRANKYINLGVSSNALVINNSQNTTLGSSDLALTQWKLYVAGWQAISAYLVVGGTLDMNTGYGYKFCVDGAAYINGIITAGQGYFSTTSGHAINATGSGTAVVSGINSGGGSGVSGSSVSGYGVEAGSTNGYAFYGTSTNSYGALVYGYNVGVYGLSTASTGNTYGVIGQGGLYGVYGYGTTCGIYGLSTAGQGVKGESSATNGIGIYGYATGTNGYGVYGYCTNAYGGYFASGSGVGCYGTSTSSYGVHGYVAGSNEGVRGTSSSGYGVNGLSSTGIGVNGSGDYGAYFTGTTIGVYGTSAGYAGYFFSSANYGIKAYSSTTYAGYFSSGWAGGYSIYCGSAIYINTDANIQGICSIAATGSLVIYSLTTSFTTEAGTLHWDSNNAKVYRVTSSRRFKDNIKDRPFNKAIYNIGFVDFNYKETGTRSFGSIAEQVAEIYPELVFCDKEGLPEGINYERYGIIAVQAIQEQKKEIDELRNELNALKLLLTKKIK